MQQLKDPQTANQQQQQQCCERCRKVVYTFHFCTRSLEAASSVISNGGEAFPSKVQDVWCNLWLLLLRSFAQKSSPQLAVDTQYVGMVCDNQGIVWSMTTMATAKGGMLLWSTDCLVL